MSVDFTVKVDFKEAVKFIDTMKNKQIPFVAAITLTRLAEGSQWELRRDIGSHFHLRSGNRLRKGIRIEPAKKSDFFSGNLHSVVKDIDPFMGIHTIGGEKKPVSHQTVAVPKNALLSRGARSTTGAIKKAYKPATLIQAMKEQKRKRSIGRGAGGQFERVTGRANRPRPFLMDMGRGEFVMAQRTGKARKGLVFLFGFYPRTKIKETWPFVQEVADYVSKNFEQVFRYEFGHAMGNL